MQTFYFLLWFLLISNNLHKLLIRIVFYWTNRYLFGLLLSRAFFVGAKIEFISWKLLIDFA